MVQLITRYGHFDEDVINVTFDCWESKELALQQSVWQDGHRLPFKNTTTSVFITTYNKADIYFGLSLMLIEWIRKHS